MSENHQEKPHSFLKFLGISISEGWSESREKFGLAVDVGLVLLAVGIIVLTWYSKHHNNFNEQGWEAGMNYWFAVIPVALWVTWFVYHVIKASHNIYLKQWKKHTDEISKKEEQIVELETKLAEKSAADKITEDKRLAKELLGYRLMALKHRLDEAEHLSGYEFSEDVKKKEWEFTTKHINETEAVFLKYMLMAELALFRIATPNPITEITNDAYYGPQRMDRQWHINSIAAKVNALKAIIEQMS